MSGHKDEEGVKREREREKIMRARKKEREMEAPAERMTNSHLSLNEEREMEKREW